MTPLENRSQLPREEMTVRPAAPTDLDALMAIYADARKRMRAAGNATQWTDGYPSADVISADISAGNSYTVISANRIIGAFSFIIGDDPTYAAIDGEWPDNRPYGTIHRIASAPGEKGIADAVLGFCRLRGQAIRIDTHADNAPMLGWIRSRGFDYCGIIRVADGTPRLAFQLSPEAPIIIEVRDRKKRYLDLLLLADEQESMIDRYLDRGRLFVATLANRAIAACVVTRESSGCFEVKNLAVMPDCRRRGYGRRMLRYVEEVVTSGSEIIIGTGETPSTLRFYQNCGYRPSHRIAGFFTDNYDHPIIEEGRLLTDMVYLSKHT